MSKTNYVMAGITSTALLLGIAGCSTQQPMSDEEWDSYAKSNQSASPPPSSYSGSSSGTTSSYLDNDIPPVPDDQSCQYWEWDYDDGVWECDDSTSTYYGHYYHGGKYYKSKPDLYNSTDYINYKKSSSFKGTSGSSYSSSGSDGTSVKGSTGFGSGSRSYGG